jgi:hypothetical protein
MDTRLAPGALGTVTVSVREKEERNVDLEDVILL